MNLVLLILVIIYFITNEGHFKFKTKHFDVNIYGLKIMNWIKSKI